MKCGEGSVATPSNKAVLWTIVLRLVDPAVSAIAKIAMIMAGSVSEATIASRLLPIPPNEEPASSPARMRKNVPSASK